MTKGRGLGRPAAPAARPGLFGGWRRSKPAGIDQLRAWTASTQGLDAVGIVDVSRHGRGKAPATLQHVGVYAYRLQPEDMPAGCTRLDALRNEIRELARADHAVVGDQDRVTDRQGRKERKAARTFSKLALKAYDAEADHALRTMKPHRLVSHVNRLSRSRETITKLGTTMGLRISDAYHGARVRELYLTAELLRTQEEEEDVLQENRARELQEAVAQADLDNERERAQPEPSTY
ncbi:DUF4041 domain-containing protein [Streptomyces sp. NPDC093970]|uniref:DUF4041 domain-containing protein n=1 Tax=Streptomyces sp. NPDC093970 TaxID=3155076 RepID=UPI00344427EC